MKTLITSALIAFTATTGAFAMTGPSSFDLQTIENFAPQADLSDLSNAEVRGLLNIIHSGDSVSEVRAKVQNVVNG